MKSLRYVWLLRCPAEATSAEARMFAKMLAAHALHTRLLCCYVLQIVSQAVHLTWQLKRAAHLTTNNVAATRQTDRQTDRCREQHTLPICSR